MVTNIFLSTHQYQAEVLGALEERDGDALILATFLARPKSKGSVVLNTTHPYELPVIDSNVFGHPEDIETIVKGKLCLLDGKW